MNAKDIAYGYAIGYNDGIQNNGSGGGEDIYVLSASVAGIAIQTITGRATASPTIDTVSFTFDTKIYKTETVAKTSSGEIRRTWSKTIITAVKNAGNIVWQCDTNNTGTITAVYDKLGNEILTGTTAISNNSVLTSTPEGIALGWALAYSNEQNSIVENLIEAYEFGTEDNGTDIIVTDLNGSGAEVYIIKADNTWKRYLGEYIQIQDTHDDGKPFLLYIANVTYQAYLNKHGRVEENSEFFTFCSFGVSSNEGVHLSGTIYDQNGDVYTGNVIFDKG